MHLACCSKAWNTEVVKYLIQECGANMDAKDNHGRTPLHYTVGNFDNFSLYLFSYNVARCLVEECHANTDVIDDNGYNVLCFLGTYALYLANLDTIYMFVNKHCLNIIIRVSQMNSLKSYGTVTTNIRNLKKKK